MKSFTASITFSLLLTGTLCAQQTQSKPAHAAATPAVSAAARICDDPYQVREPADGWPEAPVYILFHREKSKAPWGRNPAIRVPGVEAASASGARTLVCVEESRIEMGRYDSGEAGYTPSWGITLVRLADRKVYFMRSGFYGKEPPGIKFTRGAGVGAAPTKLFADWLPLVVNQKVARLKTQLRLQEMHEVSALAFSADGSRLAVAQEPRSTSSGTPPSPITVVDAATGKTIAAWHLDYLAGGLAISQSGTLVATERYGHPEVWDVASTKLVHKLDASGVESLLFGPGDALGAAGSGKATIWDVQNERVLHSAKGSRVALSPAGEWLVLNADSSGVTVQMLESGRTLATFPAIGQQEKYELSGDGQSLARSSLFGARMVAAGAPGEHSIDLPNLGVNMISAVAATRDGFVFGNGDGIVGLASVASPQPRVFATDLYSIRALAVSPDGKLLAVGDSFGAVKIWELR
jgi:hypothetical protein